MDAVRASVPAGVDESSWSEAVLEVLDWVNRLPDPDLHLAVAWCSTRSGISVLSAVRRLDSALLPEWSSRMKQCRHRVSVLPRWTSLNATRPLGSFPSGDGFDLAARGAVAAVFAAEGTSAADLELLTGSFESARSLVEAARERPEVRDVLLVLAPEWFGTVDELVAAASSMALA